MSAENRSFLQCPVSTVPYGHVHTEQDNRHGITAAACRRRNGWDYVRTTTLRTAAVLRPGRTAIVSGLGACWNWYGNSWN